MSLKSIEPLSVLSTYQQHVGAASVYWPREKENVIASNPYEKTIQTVLSVVTRANTTVNEYNKIKVAPSSCLMPVMAILALQCFSKL